MITILTLHLGDYRILVGQPNNPEEYQKMFDLRFKVYHKELGYSGASESTSDMDQFDEKGEALYVIAKINQDIVGCMRIVMTDVLPTERFYAFEKPFETRNKGDWGRMISRPHWFGYEDLPRGVITTGMIFATVKLASKYHILYGYGTMKKRALKKMVRRGFPVQILRPKKVIGMKGIQGDPLEAFFDSSDPVVPIRFTLRDCQEFMVVLMKNYFQVLDQDTWIVPSKISWWSKIKIGTHSLWVRLGQLARSF